MQKTRLKSAIAERINCRVLAFILAWMIGHAPAVGVTPLSRLVVEKTESAMTTWDDRVAGVAPYIASAIAAVVTFLTFTTYFH